MHHIHAQDAKYEANLNIAGYHQISQKFNFVISLILTSKHMWASFIDFDGLWIYCRAAKNKRHISPYTCFLARIQGLRQPSKEIRSN